MTLSTIVPRSVRSSIRRTRRAAWHKIDDLVLERDLDSYRAPSAVAEIRVDIREPADPTADIATINPDHLAIASRFQNCGFRALICHVDDAPVGYIWLHDVAEKFQHPALDRFGLRLNSEDVYLFNFYVAPEFRKGGIAAAFFSGMLTKSRDFGYKRALGFVEYRNIPARWMYSTHGWKTMYRFTGFTLCSMFLFSNRGLFCSTSVLRFFNRRHRRVVPEFLPLARRPHKAQMAIEKHQSAA